MEARVTLKYFKQRNNVNPRQAD